MNFKKNFKRFFTLSRSAEGFTLVELIVVIAILGILTSVAVPAYSTYIKSAGESVDKQNLAVMNNAFAVACAANGVDASTVTAVGMDWNGKSFGGLTSLTRSSTDDDIVTTFNTSLTLPIVFKLHDENTVNFENGQFVSTILGGTAKVPDIFKDAAGKVNQADKDAFNNSQFGTIGADKVIGQVGTVTDLAAGLFETGESESLQLMLSAGLGNLASFLTEEELAKWGEEGDSNDEKIANYVNSLAKQKFEQMYPGVNFEEATDPENENYSKYTGVASQIAANAAVLNAAKHTTSASYSEMKTLLGDSTKTPTSTLLSSVTSDPSTGLAQVSAAYGLYYAYMNSQGATVPNDPSEVLAGMDSDGFRNYINNVDEKGQAEKDLNGYNSAMNMLNSSVTTKEQAEYVAMNGFGDAGLEALMKELLGSTN